jgi:hypothetical protein
MLDYRFHSGIAVQSCSLSQIPEAPLEIRWLCRGKMVNSANSAASCTVRLINIEQTGLFLTGYCSAISNCHERGRSMPINQEEHWGKVVSSELDIQNKRPLTVAAETGGAFA